jgi:hypothetical protein
MLPLVGHDYVLSRFLKLSVCQCVSLSEAAAAGAIEPMASSELNEWFFDSRL